MNREQLISRMFDMANKVETRDEADAIDWTIWNLMPKPK